MFQLAGRKQKTAGARAVPSAPARRRTIGEAVSITFCLAAMYSVFLTRFSQSSGFPPFPAETLLVALLAIAQEMVFRHGLSKRVGIGLSLIVDALVMPLFFVPLFSESYWFYGLSFLVAGLGSSFLTGYSPAAPFLFRLSAIALVSATEFVPSLALSTLLLLLPFAFVYLERKGPVLPELGMDHRNWPRQVADGMGLFAAVAVLVYLEAFLLSQFGLNDSRLVADVLSRQAPLALLLAVTLAPVGEELLFRGYLQKRVGVVISSILFASLHYGFGSFAEIAGAFTASMVLGWYVRRSGLVIPAILGHALFNAFSLAALWAGA